MRKLGFRGVKQLAQDHTAHEWEIQDSNQFLMTPLLSAASHYLFYMCVFPSMCVLQIYVKSIFIYTYLPLYPLYLHVSI